MVNALLRVKGGLPRALGSHHNPNIPRTCPSGALTLARYFELYFRSNIQIFIQDEQKKYLCQLTISHILLGRATLQILYVLARYDLRYWKASYIKCDDIFH